MFAGAANLGKPPGEQVGQFHRDLAVGQPRVVHREQPVTSWGFINAEVPVGMGGGEGADLLEVFLLRPGLAVAPAGKVDPP